MRIGTYNMLSQIYGNQPVKKSSKTQSASGASFMDEVSFSSKGKDSQVAQTAVAPTRDFAEKLISAFEARA